MVTVGSSLFAIDHFVDSADDVGGLLSVREEKHDDKSRHRRCTENRPQAKAVMAPIGQTEPQAVRSTNRAQSVRYMLLVSDSMSIFRSAFEASTKFL